MSAAENITDAHLAGLGPVATTGVLAGARAEALARVRSMGLPERRDEYWKYTRPDALLAPVTSTVRGGPDPLLSEGAAVVTFVDGVLQGVPDVEGLSIESLGDVAKADIHWARESFGALEGRGHNRVNRPLAALNTAYASEGVVIHVQDATEVTVNLVYTSQEGASYAMLHHVIRLDDDASLRVIEEGIVGARMNTVMEVDLGARAAFSHIRIQGDDAERCVATHIFAELGEAAQFKSFTAGKNGALTRNEAVLTLLGDDGSAHIAGAVLGDSGTHHDDTVFVTHDAVAGESRQVFKKVLRNGATGVFQGKILVEPDAQKTDGYQISQSLLLDDDAQFLAKPELEIYADDVACSHGSTSGAIDEEALFYLRARGVPRRIAENLLTLSFLAEAVAEIDDADLEEAVLNCLTAWLED